MAEYRGTSGADTLDQAALGLPDYSQLFGLGGDDTITIGRGIALGGEGNDTLIGLDPLQSGAGYFENTPAGFIADLAGGLLIFLIIFIVMKGMGLAGPARTGGWI